MHRLERHLARFQVVWPEPEACDLAVSLFIQRRLQTGIGLLDVMIGLTAAGAGLSLCTFNQKHFAEIPGLTTVQPYARTGRQSRTTGVIG
jgi:predicted nucleic acid-binding protein